MTFAAAAEQCIAGAAAGWRDPRQERQWRQSLTDYVLPTLGKLPVQAVDTALVLQVLEPIWQSKTETASRIRGRIEKILDWATARHLRQGDNPARWRGHLENLLVEPAKLKRVEHHVALPFAEAAAFMARLRAAEGPAARALEFLILSATRTKETLGARWSEINFAERSWTIPAERMKGGKEHRVALCAAALQLLEIGQATAVNDFVFPGRNGALGPMALRRVLTTLGADVDVHGFRSTFRDWASEMTAHPREVADLALAHTVGRDVEKAYRRGDVFEKRRALMEDWATWCAGGAKVLAFTVRAIT